MPDHYVVGTSADASSLTEASEAAAESTERLKGSLEDVGEAGESAGEARRTSVVVSWQVNPSVLVPAPYGRPSGCVAGRRRCQSVVCQLIASSRGDAAQELFTNLIVVVFSVRGEQLGGAGAPPNCGLWLRAGRLWLAWTACGVRALSLILDFVCTPNLN
jgi:hypothetical protein